MPGQSAFVKLALSMILAGGAQGATERNSCESLTQMVLDHATIVSAVSVDAAPLKRPAAPGLKLPNVTVPKHCEVSGVAHPTSESEIHFLLWLPAPEAWNGKYMQRGNGRWAGSIQPAVLVTPLARGYAASATDGGHQAKGERPDASWAIGHPEKLIDFGHRSLHETALHSKAILQAYYRKAATHAYFAGCSDGGREALMEAERYPEDFDGIVAGAPANNWTNHFSGFAWNEMALHGRPESNIPVEKLGIIERAALAACDSLDGVRDGLIEDPRRCHFDPSVLQCTGPDRSDCLTQPQIEALQKIYAGPKNPRTGEPIYPGYEPGTEAELGAWSTWIIGPVQSAFANSFYSGAVFEDPTWDWHTMDFDRDVRVANDRTAWILNSYNPDLRSFRAHGSKLIQYHGWGDAAIAPRDSINFYEKVKTFLERYPDPRSTAPHEIASFYRLFMVPGMGHCWGGLGATNFGNTLIVDKTDAPEDPDHDVLLALDRWVTRGVAPDQIIATGKIGADPKNGSGGTRLTRPLCAYPAVAHYKGTGDTNEAANFECVQPPGR